MPCGNFLDRDEYEEDEGFSLSSDTGYSVYDEVASYSSGMPREMVSDHKLSIKFMTEKAVLFKKKDKIFWVPKSIIEFRKYHKKSGKVTVGIPLWFRIKYLDDMEEEPQVETTEERAELLGFADLGGTRDGWRDAIFKVPQKEHKQNW